MSCHVILQASRYIFPEAASLVQEIQKHMVTEFSVLEICLRTTGHAFGAFVSLILGMRPIRTDVKRLKVVIWRPRVILCSLLLMYLNETLCSNSHLFIYLS